MHYTLNSTRAYHVNQLSTLGWELTVCNALYQDGTAVRKILSRSDSYGHLLYDYLDLFLPMGQIRRVIEVGGGYGYLMKDFLDRNRSLEPCMLDISPFLLQKQKEILGEHHVSYREDDFLESDPAVLNAFDLAVMNENLGDFPTLVNLSQDVFRSFPEADDPELGKAIRLFAQYEFDPPKGKTFNLNVGAIAAVEKLCAAGIPYIFLGEHSCEAVVPEALGSLVRIESSGLPERITLMGHDEYSIKFSYLEQVALAFNYSAIRGPFADYVTVDLTEKVRQALSSRRRSGDEDEIISQFVEDLYKYEYLILTKNRSGEKWSQVKKRRALRMLRGRPGAHEADVALPERRR
jgi:hypothetical protein